MNPANIVFLELKTINEQAVELRYRLPERKQYESRTLQLAEIAGLYDFADRDFTRHSPDLAKIGRQLFNWLDGAERWLSRSIQQQRGLLVLAIDSQGVLGGLPWEILYYEGFLVARSIVPIRVVAASRGDKKPSPFQLRALFMATDPENVYPKLNFEAEEALILQETRDLAMELRVEESGCVKELKSFWRRFKDYFDIFHLSGHADIGKDGVPFFITESDEGQRVDATIADFAAAFNFRYPALIFLSGCRTGESTKQGGVASLAAGLVAQGAPAVLGWGRPVGDMGAIAAAMLLYRSLAEGFELAEALALTYQGLIQEQVSDWCLLRLYAERGAWGALVVPPGDTVPQPLPESSADFLDPSNGLVKVAGKDGFVGRRRYLQRGLRALRSPKYTGIWLHGLGGVGKSTIACRLLDRLSPSYDRLVIVGALDEEKLLNLLGRQCENPAGNQILEDGNLSLTQRLKLFLKNGLNHPQQRLVFVLDDFEENVEFRETGEPAGALDNPPVLKAGVVAVLTALFEGIVGSQLPHKVIVTSRYDLVLPSGFDNRVQRLPVGRMDRSDVAKLTERLGAFSTDSGVEEGLRLRAEAIADGYPRLLEALDKVLLDQRTDAGAILAAMEGQQQQFLANILLERLLAQQEPEMTEMLRRGMLFELPVPLGAMQAICVDVVGFERQVSRAGALGLLESGLHVGVVRVPRVLGLELVGERREWAALAVQELYREWIEGAESSTEEQQFEIHRLAMLGGDGQIAVDMAQRLSERWIDLSRFRAAQSICEKTLALQKDGMLIYNLSIIYQTLGDLPKALDYCQQSIEINREIGNRQGEAASLHQLSRIYQALGDYSQALSLSHLSIQIQREIGDRQGEAASLHQLSIIYHALGDYPQALSLSHLSIEILREIGNRHGEAASLAQVAMIAYQQGDPTLERELRLQVVAIRSTIGDYESLIIDLWNLGARDEPDALGFLAQSLWLTVHCATNLQYAISIISTIYQKVPSGVGGASQYENHLESLLGATALYFCQTRSHPDQAQLTELSDLIIIHAAQQQGITSQTDVDQWFTTNHLHEPEHFLPALLQALATIIGDGWLFDRSVFQQKST